MMETIPLQSHQHLLITIACDQILRVYQSDGADCCILTQSKKIPCFDEHPKNF